MDPINIICFYYYHYYYLKNKVYPHYDRNRTVVQTQRLVEPPVKLSLLYCIRIGMISVIMGAPTPTSRWTLKQQGRNKNEENRKQ